MSSRTLKKEIHRLLTRGEFRENLEVLLTIPARQAVNPLFSFFYHMDPTLKWHAVTAMGQVVSYLADSNMESGRVVMRRLIWNLNDESGGIGWGSPEAMGDIMANHEGLAGEYHRLLVSYIRPEGNFLEHEELQKGLLWGLARLAAVRPVLVEEAGPDLVPFLVTKHPEHRGLAALTAGAVQEQSARRALKALVSDHAEIDLYWNQVFKKIRVGDIAEKALKRFK